VKLHVHVPTLDIWLGPYDDEDTPREQLELRMAALYPGMDVEIHEDSPFVVRRRERAATTTD